MSTKLPESKLKSIEAYTDAIKALRGMSTGFDAGDKYDLRKFKKISDISPARRRRIREYWQTAREAESQGKSIAKYRSKERLKAVQEYSRLDYQKGFKVAFIEKRYDEKMTFKKKDGKTVVKGYESQTTGISHRDIVFDKKKLIKDPRKYLKNLISENMQSKDLGIVINGKYTIKSMPKNAGAMVNYVIRLMNKYENHGDWLDGIQITTGPNASAVSRMMKNQTNHYNKTRDFRKENYDIDRKLQEAQKKYTQKPTKRRKAAIANYMRQKVNVVKLIKAANKKYGY